MTQKLFGTDGVRGRANQAPMDSETIMQLGRAAAYVLRNGKHQHRIVIGKDTRLSGYMLETALASGIVSMGTDVVLVGSLPTPGVAFITRSMRADAGVVISGSHNDWRDNGIKFFDKKGFKLSDRDEKNIEELIVTHAVQGKTVSSDKVGRAFRVEDAAGRYIQFLKSTFPAELGLDALKIVVDCSNGAGYKVAPAVLEELGAQVIAIANEPDGKNINLNCGSLHTKSLCEKVREVGADCGIALDGDADRVIMCDEKGEVIDGDVIMALSALHLKKLGKLKKNTLVATVMSNLALDHTLKKEGIEVIRAGVGDKQVVRTMCEEGYNLGGEQSGHIIFLDHNMAGDGCLAALQMLAMMLLANKPLSELKTVMTPYPQVLHNIKVKEKRDFSQIPEVAHLIGLAERDLEGKGRLLIRYSGTENVARVMVEGEPYHLIEQIALSLSEEITKHLGV